MGATPMPNPLMRLPGWHHAQAGGFLGKPSETMSDRPKSLLIPLDEGGFGNPVPVSGLARDQAADLGAHGEVLVLAQARAEFRQRHGYLESHAEICVSPEDDVELRRISLTNHSNVPRMVEVTTYSEVVLAPAAADASPTGDTGTVHGWPGGSAGSRRA